MDFKIGYVLRFLFGSKIMKGIPLGVNVRRERSFVRNLGANLWFFFKRTRLLFVERKKLREG